MKKRILLLLIFTSVSCTLSKSKEKNNALLINPALQQSLKAYVNLPVYSQKEWFTLAILNDITNGDTSIFKRINVEISEIQQQLEADSILNTFMEEPVFTKKVITTMQESYRVKIFTHLENTITIVRVDNQNDDYNVIYKKYRIDCNPPILSGKSLEKSCLILLEKRVKSLSEKEWKILQAFVQETEFWTIPLMSFPKNCFDGSNWDIEGWQNGAYKKMSSRCPGKYNPIKVFGEELLNLI